MLLSTEKKTSNEKKITITTDGEQSLKEEIMTRLMEIKSGPCAYFLSLLLRAESTSSTGFQQALRPGEGEQAEEEEEEG